MRVVIFAAIGLSAVFFNAGEASAYSLQMWLRADAGVEAHDYSASGGDTADVSAWRDQSGQGNDVSQAAIANMPELVANGLNGNPVVRFSGEGGTATSASPDKEFLTGSLTSSLDLNLATVLAIGSFNASTDGLGFLELSPLAGNGGYSPFNRGGATELFSHHREGDGSATIRLQNDAGNLDTAHHLFTSTVDKASGNLDLFLDGVDIGAVINGDNDSVVLMGDATHVTVGARQAGFKWWLGGDVGEILVFDGILSPDELTGLHHILGDRWGIGTPLATEAQISVGQALLVPEPSTALLLGLGLAGMGMKRRRAGRGR